MKKRYSMMRQSFFLVSILFSLSMAGMNRIINYSSPKRVTDALVQDGGAILLATSGGLAEYTGDTARFPRGAGLHNPALSVLTRDAEGALWCGGADGTLYRLNGLHRRADRFTELQVMGDVQIESILPVGSHLIVGHSAGISLFDTKKETFTATISSFGQDSSGAAIEGAVRNMLLSEDTLYAFVNTVPMAFPDVEDRLGSLAFSDPFLWERYPTSGDDERSRSIFRTDSGKIIFLPAPAIEDGATYLAANGGALERIEADGTVLDTVQELPAPDTIVSLTRLSDGRIVIGGMRYSAEIFSPGDGSRRITLDGLRTNTISRIMLSSRGALWIVPKLSKYNESWTDPNSTDRIVRIKNGSYDYFGEPSPGYGELGRSDTIMAIAEDSAGAIWIGSPSDHAKRYKDGQWSRLIIDPDPPVEEPPYFDTTGKGRGWMKVDGLHCDYSGTVWGLYWGHTDGSQEPYAWAFDPETGQHRYVGNVLEDDQRSPYYISACNDSTLYIQFNDARGNYTLLDLTNDYFDTAAVSDDALVADSGEVGSTVSFVAAASSGTVLCATEDGLRALRFDRSAGRMVTGEVGTQSLKTVEPGAQYRINAPVPYRRTDVWAGERDGGVVLYELREYLNTAGGVDSFSVHRDENYPEISAVTGLHATSPEDLVWDARENRLWVASLSGLSAVDLGRKTVPNEENEELKVYPNPYVKSRHDAVTIAGISKNSYVDIYTLSGRAVAHLTADNGARVDKTEQGIFQYRWKPEEGITPGTYIVIAKDGREDRENSISGKLLVLP
ncbi:MAG: hypothetical protein ACQEQV_01010 [Fibrobacterota bacterium]